MEAYSRYLVKVQPDNGGDSGVKGIERATVIRVHNPPGLEIDDNLLDHVPDPVYRVLNSFPSPRNPGILVA
jgi:hypothetical protein